MEEEKVSVSDAASAFNVFSTEIRSKIDGLAKQILLVSGGIQTITIGAFLGGTAPALSDSSIESLRCGWLLLSISIMACLTLMLFQVFGLIHVGLKHANKLKSGRQGLEIMNTWLPLRIVNWCVGLTAFGGCVVGVFFISKAAMSLIGIPHGI